VDDDLSRSPYNSFVDRSINRSTRKHTNRSLDKQDEWRDPAKKARANAPGSKYPPRMEADMSEEEKAQAQRTQQAQAGEQEKEKEKQGAGGREAGASKKNKKKKKPPAAGEEGTDAGGEKKSGYRHWEKESGSADYRPGA
jgi:hypothetical protein